MELLTHRRQPVIARSFLIAAVSFPDFHRDPVEDWASRILLWALVLAITLAILALIRVVRRQASSTGGRALVLVSAVLLPAFCVLTGMLLVFPRAERVAFCGSCHGAIAPYVDDMRDGSATGLAAVHFRNQYIATNQCYACHASYGLFGTAKAKVNGIRQVLRYYAGTYDRPLAMWEPYRNQECLKCHAESAKWRTHEEHVDNNALAALITNRTSCTDCHESGHTIDRVSLGGER